MAIKPHILLFVVLVVSVACHERPTVERDAYVGFHPIQHHEDLLRPSELAALSKKYGTAVIICRVEPGSPANQADLRAWDILRRYNGEAIRSLDDLDRA